MLDKIVNGQRVRMSAEETAAIEADWAAMAEKQVIKNRDGLKLSFAQLLIGLVTEGLITEAQGEDWLSGMLPPPVEAIIASLPAGQRFAARARALRPSEVLRSDPMVGMLGAAAKKTDADLDAFFATYAAV